MLTELNYKKRYGDWALISGAAEGIGAAYCQRIAEMGMSIVMLDINADALHETANRLRKTFPDIAIKEIVVDLADASALNEEMDKIETLDIGLLIANAGIGAVGRWLDVSQEMKLKLIAVNCASTLILADRLTPKMVEQKRGGIIIMSSGSAEVGSSFIVTYAATKAFDRIFAEGLWAELGPHGIDVTTVMPGAVNTQGFRNTIPTGKKPIKEMQPVDPFLVVDSALRGLGKEVNVKPTNSGSFSSIIMKMMQLFLPREKLLALGNKVVSAMYNR